MEKVEVKKIYKSESIDELKEIIKKKDIIINDLIKKINNMHSIDNKKNNNLKIKKNRLEIMNEIMRYGIY